MVSNDSRPCQGADDLVAGVTATDRAAAIPLAGRLARRSYVSPWVVVTVRGEHVSTRVAVVPEHVVERAVEAIAGYVEPA